MKTLLFSTIVLFAFYTNAHESRPLKISDIEHLFKSGENVGYVSSTTSIKSRTQNCNLISGCSEWQTISPLITYKWEECIPSAGGCFYEAQTDLVKLTSPINTFFELEAVGNVKFMFTLQSENKKQSVFKCSGKLPMNSTIIDATVIECFSNQWSAFEWSEGRLFWFEGTISKSGFSLISDFLYGDGTNNVRKQILIEGIF